MKRALTQWMSGLIQVLYVSDVQNFPLDNSISNQSVSNVPGCICYMHEEVNPEGNTSAKVVHVRVNLFSLRHDLICSVLYGYRLTLIYCLTSLVCLSC